MNYMDIKRRKSNKIFAGGVPIGGDSPVTIQSMTTTDTTDVNATVRQIKRLERVGCQIIRVAVLNEQAAKAIIKIKPKIKIPLVADIHFDYRLALSSIRYGADKIRLNPGNIEKEAHVEQVIRLAKEYKIPMRIGINSGSVKRHLKNSLVEDMVSAAREYLLLFEKYGFFDVVVSLKAHDILTTIEAYRRMANVSDVPLHLGITAAGPLQSGIVKSCIGIGGLLLEGIGDTIRVSLTADPIEEVEVGKKILAALELRKSGIELISCPTCGRCTIDLISLVKQAEKKIAVLNHNFSGKKLKVAMMGCVVNGPQEAKDADIGIAWGGKSGILFKKGKKIRLVKESEIIDVLIQEVRNEMD
ncbi:MAG: flavodoxin-dependent (E)-4-hydroxy-3-methylbut-2-enyl-diphosphate synthase [Candidatus Omnitrophica bacterium]|nr:flavodoxin-dependent (E)-4-hydroxy-3-methylbut-2-enyl-diphosphate synthase [Candidatus Omnitrophota bacterium]